MSDLPTGFNLTLEQELLRDSVRQVTREKIAPRAKEVDQTGEFPADIAELLFQSGLITLMLPEKYGGSSCNNTSLCLCTEEVAKACGSSALLVVSQAVGLYPLIMWGSNELKSRYFSLMEDEVAIAAFCLTEPDAGSDAASISTSARSEGDHFILDGTKCFVTNGGVASFYSVLAKTDPEAGHR